MASFSIYTDHQVLFGWWNLGNCGGLYMQLG